MKRLPGLGSLRGRLFAATLVAVALALVLAGVLLHGLFRDHAMRQHRIVLEAHLDQLTARLEVDAAGRPRIDPAAMSDPRWSRPLSGLYWQVDERRSGEVRRGVLRSRSLWDAVLTLADDPLAPGDVHVHAAAGPGGAALVAVERSVKGDDVGAGWRLVVAGDTAAVNSEVDRFTGALAASLGAIGALLAAAALAQVAVGLRPLRAMQASLLAVRDGREPRIGGRFPGEVQPLVDAFNDVLDRHERSVARARTHAGDLAHAVRTPLAVMRQAADASLRDPAAGAAALARIVGEQVDIAGRQVERHLARARAAGASRRPGARVPLAPVLEGLGRAMARVHADRGVSMTIGGAALQPAFAGDEQDLHELLGNLIDNAFKWARHTVRVQVDEAPADVGTWLQVTIDDDGPGLSPAEAANVRARGVRADESVPGSGLGLAIVDELVGLYGGQMVLERAPLGGLRVALTLPAVARGPESPNQA